MSKLGKDTKLGYQYEMKNQYKGKPIETPISVIIELYFNNNLRRDLDNFNKLILDAGSGLIWKDDSLITELIIRKYIDKKKPRVELTVC